MPTAIYLGKNGKRIEVEIWQNWMESAAILANKFMKYDIDKDYNPINPLSYNEAASVSFLVSAAQRAGFIALAEYVTNKAAHELGDEDRNGRADLWMCDTRGHHWEFEFKQPYAKMFRPTSFEKMMCASRKEAKALIISGSSLNDRGITPVAGRIFYAIGSVLDRTEKFEDRLRDFCIEGTFEADDHTWIRHGWKLTPRADSAPTYFLFDVMKNR